MEEQLDIFSLLLESGLVVKFVLLLLLVASIVSWAIVLKKYAALKAIRRQNGQFLAQFKDSQSVDDFLIRVEPLDETVYRNIFIEGQRELEKIKNNLKGRDERGPLKGYFRDFGCEAIERAVKKEMHRNDIKLGRHLWALASIGSITPFVGLFGTVWGIIDSFTGLASGGGTLDAVAPGIAEALVATAVGLGAAIPAVWFYNYFSGQNAELRTEMEVFGQEFLNIIERSAL